MGTVQPVGYRLAHANNWKSNWQNHSHQLWDPLESTCRHASLSIL